MYLLIAHDIQGFAGIEVIMPQFLSSNPEGYG